MTPASRPAESSPLWVISTYFNFAGYQRRLSNYHAFRQNLAAPLLTIEFSPGLGFALQPEDADILIQCAKGDVMWQKERLLNHALSFLPASCRYVAWIDCDVIFERDDWAKHVVAALQNSPLLQPFSRVYHAPAEARPSEFRSSEQWMTQPSLGAAVNAGNSFETCMRSMMLRENGTVTPGMAWAARRELLEGRGLFDASIIGGGDTALACAAFGQPELAMELHQMNFHQRERYANWARPFHREVMGKVTHVPGSIVHLWHGEIQHRRPSSRHADLSPHDFDPARDIIAAEDGAWRWATDKPALHAYLKNYFASRQEDGRRTADRSNILV